MGNLHQLYEDMLQNKLERKEFLKQINKNNVDERDNNARTLLFKAIKNDDIDLALSLLNLGASIHVKDKFEDTPALLALSKMNEQLLSAMLDHGLNIDQLDSQGCSELFWKIKKGDHKDALILLKLGADVKRINHDKQSILQTALSNEIEEETKKIIITLLFEFGLGIGQDFTGIELPPNIMDKCVAIGAKKDGQLVTHATPGFADVILTLDELKTAIDKKEERFNYKHLIRQNRVLHNQELLALLKPLKIELKKRWHASSGARVKPLTELVVRLFVDSKGNLTFFNQVLEQLNNNGKTLPPELSDQVIKRYKYHINKASLSLTYSEKSRLFGAPPGLKKELESNAANEVVEVVKDKALQSSVNKKDQ